MTKVELGAHRFSDLRWVECQSLTEARDLAKAMVEMNVAYPAKLRIAGVVRLERWPDEQLCFRWRTVRHVDGVPLEAFAKELTPVVPGPLPVCA